MKDSNWNAKRNAKKALMISLLLGSLLLTARLIGAAQQEVVDQQDSTGLPSKNWKRGFAISPVTLNLDGKDKKLVGVGSYIVNAQAACADCHTNPLFLPGGNPFLGQPERLNIERYLAGGRAFGPVVRSANITPDVQTGQPAGLTFDQFSEVMRTGRDFKNRHPQLSPLLQNHPWPIFGKMTDEDLRAIYEYLRAIPHADPAP